MSHVVVFEPKRDEQKIHHLGALRDACPCHTTIKDKTKPALWLDLMPGATLGADGKLYDKEGNLVLKGNMHYRSWKDDHGGRLYGDSAVPEGMTEAEFGENAVAVIRLTEAGKDETPRAYEIGLIPHVDAETGEFTYRPAYDFHCGGNGIEEYVGASKPRAAGRNAKGETIYKLEDAMPNTLMYYQMMCTALAAREAGHSLEFVEQEDGTYAAVVDREGVGV